MNNSQNILNSSKKFLPLNHESLPRVSVEKENIKLSKFESNSIKNAKLLKLPNNAESFIRITTSIFPESNENSLNENKSGLNLFPNKLKNIQINKLKNENMLSKMFDKIKYVKRFKRPTPHSKREKIFKKYNFLNQMNHCNTKFKIVHIFHNLSNKWKSLLENYLERVFLMHLHLRHIKDFSDLMSNRHVLYESIQNPDILLERFTLGNNVIKNFCKGFVSFILMFHDDLVKHNFITIRSANSFSKKVD